MEVIISRSFVKDLKTKPKDIVRAVENLIAQLEEAPSLDKVNLDIKKLEGQKKVNTFIVSG